MESVSVHVTKPFSSLHVYFALYETGALYISVGFADCTLNV